MLIMVLIVIAENAMNWNGEKLEAFTEGVHSFSYPRELEIVLNVLVRLVFLSMISLYVFSDHISAIEISTVQLLSES